MSQTRNDLNAISMKKQVETISSNSNIDLSIAKTSSDVHAFVGNKPNVVVSQSPPVKTGDNTKPSFIIPKGSKTLLIRKRNLFDVEDGVDLNGGINVDVDIKKDDTTKKLDRKTRWGPDPKNDPVVRRGLALALQACLNVVTSMYLPLIFSILYVL
jgi:hypothetical protein